MYSAAMFHFAHAVLIFGRADRSIEARYSRCPHDMPDADRWPYFTEQLRQLDPAAELLAIVDDDAHEHPLVTTARGGQPRDDTAHMP